MMRRNDWLGLGFLACSLIAPSHAGEGAAPSKKPALESLRTGMNSRTERYRGTARDRDGHLLYREEHEVDYRDERVQRARSRYLSPEGGLLAELDSDFPSGVSLPKYRFSNRVANYEEGVECCTENRLEVFHRDRRKTLEFRPSWVSGQGFHYLTREKLDAIAAGESQEFKFLIPSKLDVYDFRIRSGGRDPNEPEWQRVLLEIDQWFFRLFAPKIIATYDLRTRRLMRYEGPSNLEDLQGNVPTVRIDYDYSPLPSAANNPTPAASRRDSKQP